MTTSFYNGVLAFKTYQSAIDVWGNNISNVNTPAFKENIPEFSTLFSTSYENSIVSSDMGFSSILHSTAKNTSLGSLIKTDNQFDLAITGKGWFKVNYNNQEYYTRNGSFKRDKDGFLVNDNGAYLMVANANNIIKTNNGYQINKNINTDNLITTATLSPISLPNDLIIPATPTQNVKLSLNLNNGDTIDSTAPAKETTDFSALYNKENQDIKVRNGDSFIVGYGDNITYNGNLEYEICIEDDKIDGNDVNYDFSVNGKNIQLTLPDGSTKEEIQNALKQALDDNNIRNEITSNGIKILDSEKIIISSNNSLVNNVAAAKLTYKSTPSNQFEFDTISSFENIIQNLAQNVYGNNISISFDNNTGQIVATNNSTTDNINAFLLKDENTNENLYTSLYPLFNTILPNTTAKSENLKINSQTIEGNIYSANGDKDTLSFTFSKQKVLTNSTIWNLEIISKDENENILETKNYTLTFDENGLLTSSKNLTINSPQNINIDISQVTSYEKVDNQISYSFSQDGISEGYLTSYQIDELGRIIANFSNSQSSVLAQIPLFNFKNEQGLESIGNNLFKETSNSSKGEILTKNGEYIPTAKIKSHYLESSNVNFSQAMTELIVNQKAFSATAKTVTTSDEMIQKAINMKK